MLGSLSETSLRTFALSDWFAAPLLHSSTTTRSWGTLVPTQAQGQESELSAALYDLVGLRTIPLATLRIPDLLRPLQYALVVSRIYANLNRESPAWKTIARSFEINDESFSWKFPDGSVDGGGVTLRADTLYDEVLLAAYNVAAALTQLVVVLNDDKATTGVPATTESDYVIPLRLSAAAQIIFESLAVYSKQNDRIVSKRVRINAGGSTAPFSRQPLLLPLSSELLEAATQLAHAQLTSLHILHQQTLENFDNANDFLHTGNAYDTCYNQLEQASRGRLGPGPIISVIPGLAQRRVACNRHFAKAVAYMNFYDQHEGTRVNNGLLRLIGSALDDTQRSAKKGKLLALAHNDTDPLKDNLNADPMYLMRNTITSAIATARQQYIGDADLTGITDQEVSSAYGMVSDVPSIGTLPNGTRVWSASEFGSHLADICERCLQLLDTSTTTTANDIYGVVIGAYTPSSSSPPPPPLSVVAVAKVDPLVTLVNNLPEDVRPYGALIIALNGFGQLVAKFGAQKKNKSSLAQSSDDVERQDYSIWLQGCNNCMQSLHRMIHIVFFLRTLDDLTVDNPPIALNVIRRLCDSIASFEYTNAIQLYHQHVDPRRTAIAIDTPVFIVLMGQLRDMRLMIST